MKIIVDKTREYVERDAKWVVAELERRRRTDPFLINPLGLSGYAVRFPTVCSDCGGTYWPVQQYETHRGCDARKSGAGF